ncbi:MED7 protein-domain-containing protein [Lineolata rhizophorae]|uniref:Mediator of RNA polymerase II transcription subunit 7 n=1 Tax=Lineolata rhizophorae TaxID=578093 RepID=A0A6A6NYE2_9PEZI|nr:MED7 protein-domain-containing protein [Lineolata rhizophorae]
MADDDDQANALRSTYPAPPPFYRYFTPSNVARAAALTEAAGADDGAPPRLPPDLRFLVPPEPPTDKYFCFGEAKDAHERIYSLKEQELEQLYESPEASPAGATAARPSAGVQPEETRERAFQLKKMVKAILLNYLELVAILAVNPAHFVDKINHLTWLFLNAHALINKYRPHQERETLILMMEEELEMKRAEVDAVKRMKDKVEGVLDALAKDVPDAALLLDDIERDPSTDSRRQGPIAVWEGMDADIAF